MNGPGILWMLQVAVGLSMAGPMYIVGIELLRAGNPAVGVGFLALGTVALFFPSYLVRRIGGPRSWIRSLVGTSAETEEESTGRPERND